jgi:hypothetical protein
MTCIVGLKHPKLGVLMGCDSFVGNIEVRHPFGVSKIRRPIPGLLIGHTGGVRVLQAVCAEGRFEPWNPKRWDPEGYVVRSVIPAMKRALKASGELAVESGLESMRDRNYFLVGFGSSLFDVGSGFEAIPHGGLFHAVGVDAGVNLVEGALTALERRGLLLDDPERAILEALEIAGGVCNLVSGPYFVHKCGQPVLVKARPAPAKKPKKKVPARRAAA